MSHMKKMPKGQDTKKKDLKENDKRKYKNDKDSGDDDDNNYNIYNMPIDKYLYRLKHIDYRWIDILNMHFIHQRKINNI